MIIAGGFIDSIVNPTYHYVPFVKDGKLAINSLTVSSLFYYQILKLAKNEAEARGEEFTYEHSEVLSFYLDDDIEEAYESIKRHRDDIYHEHGTIIDHMILVEELFRTYDSGDIQDSMTHPANGIPRSNTPMIGSDVDLATLESASSSSRT